jgi:hypothetical protein
MQQPGRWIPWKRLQLVQQKWSSDRKKPEWQIVSHTRKRMSKQKSAETAEKNKYSQPVWITLPHALRWWYNRKCPWNRY